MLALRIYFKRDYQRDLYLGGLTYDPFPPISRFLEQRRVVKWILTVNFKSDLNNISTYGISVYANGHLILTSHKF